MKMKKRLITTRSLVGFALPLMVVLIFGCNISGADAGVNLGLEIPENEPIVRLASVIENASEYDDKTIVVKGTVSSQCASLCHFIFQDGVHTATIYPQGFKFPKLERGKSVTLYTQVISGEGQVVFSALGLKM